VLSTPDAVRDRRAHVAATSLYLVCDSRPSGRDLAWVLRESIIGGVDIVQLRDKNLRDRELSAVATEARAICRELGALFIVNDRPAVAIAAGADGVHVGQDDLPVSEVRQIVGPELLIGLSTHTAEQLRAASVTQADYLGVGPVHPTPTKAGRPAVGNELVEYAAGHTSLPFFAIGGLNAANVPDVLRAGARRVAVVRAIADSGDPRSSARELRELLEKQPTAQDDGLRN